MPSLSRAAAGLVFAGVLTALGGASGWQSSASAAVPVQPASPPPVTRVPLRGPGVHLEVTINGRGPFLVGFDTGASGAAWVTRALVRRLNLPTIDRMRIGDGSGLNGREVETVRIDSLRIGAVSFEGLRAPVLGDGPLQDGSTDAYATLGFELFRGHLLTLDYPQAELRIWAGALPQADGRTVLNYALDSGGPHVDIDVAGHRLRALIDSGNQGGLLLPRSFAETLPLRGPVRPTGRLASALGEFDLFAGELAGEVAIGAFTFPQSLLFFSDAVRVPNVGRTIIRTFAVTFDQVNRRIQLTRPSPQ